MDHKPNCTFKGFHIALTAFRGAGPDSSLTITDEGIIFDHNIHTPNEEDKVIEFTFCPCCGENLREDLAEKQGSGIMKVWITCPKCNGKTPIDYSSGIPKACSTCNGYGKIYTVKGRLA